MDKKRDELNVVFFILTDDIQTGVISNFACTYYKNKTS